MELQSYAAPVAYNNLSVPLNFPHAAGHSCKRRHSSSSRPSLAIVQSALHARFPIRKGSSCRSQPLAAHKALILESSLGSFRISADSRDRGRDLIAGRPRGRFAGGSGHPVGRLSGEGLVEAGLGGPFDGRGKHR